MIVAEVARDPTQPRPKLRALAQLRHLFPRRHKRLLRDIVAPCHVTARTESHGTYHRLMSFDDFAKSRRISRQVSRDQLLIIHGRGE